MMQCPGGQIVPSSTDPTELCVNGMSFSRRDSKWANSALVVTIAHDDHILKSYREKHGALAGVAFQQEMERRAAAMGTGGWNNDDGDEDRNKDKNDNNHPLLTVPVQRVTDFIEGRVSKSIPSSSYRLGIVSAPCHEIYPPDINAALCDALVNYFNKTLPGFVCDEALLHGVETRTSSPVRIARNRTTLKATGVEGLFPAGEGAGFAGGIVSAAADGINVAQAIGRSQEEDGESSSSSSGNYRQSKTDSPRRGTADFFY